jgi:flagellin
MNVTSPVKISATISYGTGDGNFTADLSDLRDKINGFTGTTGIQASLSADKTYIDLKSPDGYDIVIENVDFPTRTHADRVTATAAATAVHTNDIITTNADHGFQIGDQVRINGCAVGEDMDGITTGVTYTIADTNFAARTFNLTTSDGVAVDVAVDNNANVVFEKVEPSLNFQTMDRNKNAKGVAVGLVDKELLAEIGPNAMDSARITGDVQYESSQVFTLVPAVKDSLFRDAPPAASLLQVSEMDILTVDASHKMLTSIDGALKRVDAERGDLGATMNRMGHTIDNLGNIVVNSSAARSRIEDADMALETAELAKSQILQQAATAMVGQANKAMQTILSLLR